MNQCRFGLLLLALCLPAGCHRPTHEPAQFAALRAEAEALMRTDPAATGQAREVPPLRWPPAIARLHPERVTAYPTGVDIAIQEGVDGGWGCHVTRDRRDLPMPASCYEALAPAVYWHGPC